MPIIEKLIYPTDIVAGSIAIYENIWSKEKIYEYINIIDKITLDKTLNIKFKKSETIAENNGYIDQSRSKRQNVEIALTDVAKINNDLKKINDDFTEILISAIQQYQSIFKIPEIYYKEGYNILKYEFGQHFESHYDGGSDTARSVSPILYLNDDYEGGEIEFTNFNLKIKPKAGTLYVFPANYAYRHTAHPVKSGIKYAIVTWLHDRII